MRPRRQSDAEHRVEVRPLGVEGDVELADDRRDHQQAQSAPHLDADAAPLSEPERDDERHLAVVEVAVGGQKALGTEAVRPRPVGRVVVDRPRVEEDDGAAAQSDAGVEFDVAGELALEERVERAAAARLGERRAAVGQRAHRVHRQTLAAADAVNQLAPHSLLKPRSTKVCCCCCCYTVRQKKGTNFLLCASVLLFDRNR